ncbi:hypothetical protein BC936DRAFT_136811 [Jimgerdemannia flammicorona]|uniref:Uncharacterized protein n=1 Tax=Jimgerdemannia flammicorona TaxID=994334 RepID=A0A433CYR8_9FUNG|nr:hypothetical protein BC936DRAFT_136811 [Jimgerdemannia flammicorona]
MYTMRIYHLFFLFYFIPKLSLCRRLKRSVGCHRHPKLLPRFDRRGEEWMGRWFELNDEDTRNGGGFHADLVLRRRKHLWVRWGVIEVVILAPILITVLSHIITFLRRNGTPVVVTTSAPSSPRSSSPARPSKSSAGRASTPDPSLLTPHVVRDLTKSPKNQRRSASPAPKAADLKRSLSAPTPPAGGRKDKERDRDKEKEREKNKEREGKDKDKEKEPRVPRKRPPGAEGTGVPA